jgi:AcrR family transcriptional regulator
MKKKQNKLEPPAKPSATSKPTRGPQPAFTREQIASASVKIADAEGIDALSMRRIAAELGSGTASLYRYVAKKNELLDLMVEVVIVEDKPQKLTGDWREDLRKMAHRSRRMILRHPWMIAVSSYRSSLGPNLLSWLELSLGAVDQLGLDIDEMLVISNTIYAFARGYAAGEIAEQEASRRSGLTREQWMAARAGSTHEKLNTGKYPMFERVVKDAKAPHDPNAAERGFSLGLDHILDGIAARLSATRAEPLKRGSSKSFKSNYRSKS